MGIGVGSARIPPGGSCVENMRGTWGRGRRGAELGSQPLGICRGAALAPRVGAGRRNKRRRGQARPRGQQTGPSPHCNRDAGLLSCLSFSESLVRLSATTATSVTQTQSETQGKLRHSTAEEPYLPKRHLIPGDLQETSKLRAAAAAAEAREGAHRSLSSGSCRELTPRNSPRGPIRSCHWVGLSLRKRGAPSPRVPSPQQRLDFFSGPSRLLSLPTAGGGVGSKGGAEPRGGGPEGGGRRGRPHPHL